VGRRLARIAIWVGGVALSIAVLDLVGVPAGEWIRDLFRRLGEIPPWAVVAGVLLETAQTSLAALAWHGILRAALPLFLSVSGSFSIKLGFLADHTALVVLIAAGAIVLLALLARILWRGLEGLRRQLVAGGAILRSPRRTLTGLFLPVLGSYAARLAIVAVFLAAYGIPVSFHSVATVTASNSISNSVSATPGGVGVTQAMNSAALSGEASAADATAYSIGQQLVVSAWDVLFAVVMVSWVFGWSGGRALVESSFAEAKTRSVEMRKRRKGHAGQERAEG
jgi:hypothetical protein